MINIVLVCNAGMSTSMLAKRMVEAGKGEFDVNAYSEQEYLKHTDVADIIMVGPQVRYLIDQIKESTKNRIPVVSIDPLAYGRMNAAEVLKQAKEILNK